MDRYDKMEAMRKDLERFERIPSRLRLALINSRFSSVEEVKAAFIKDRDAELGRFLRSPGVGTLTLQQMMSFLDLPTTNEKIAVDVHRKYNIVLASNSYELTKDERSLIRRLITAQLIMTDDQHAREELKELKEKMR